MKLLIRIFFLGSIFRISKFGWYLIITCIILLMKYMKNAPSLPTDFLPIMAIGIGISLVSLLFELLEERKQRNALKEAEKLFKERFD
ncbi:hypothetical protein Q0590_25020 [Rhodocytophaga aerolata]|uniref:Uncharacterized protein n=1 Tax=Rhodocytophaga aerolata TaxID=455078 RepID=A0ABT8REF6_9BACT|nr:hypothetical protein [Rhodocytophaga aerolata]MDO1449563.1 hypothetical protein [Rhodocytophaga aerolata]